MGRVIKEQRLGSDMYNVSIDSLVFPSRTPSLRFSLRRVRVSRALELALEVCLQRDDEHG